MFGENTKYVASLTILMVMTLIIPGVRNNLVSSSWSSISVQPAAAIYSYQTINSNSYMGKSLPSISPVSASVDSGKNIKLNLNFPSNTISSSLYFICPQGVASAVGVCNSYVNVTSNTDWSTLFNNLTTQPQTIQVVYTVISNGQGLSTSATIVVKPPVQALSVSNMTCSVNVDQNMIPTFTFVGKPTGGLGSYSYTIFNKNGPIPYSVNKNQTANYNIPSNHIPGSWGYIQNTNVQDSYLVVSSGDNTANVQCSKLTVSPPSVSNLSVSYGPKSLLSTGLTFQPFVFNATITAGSEPVYISKTLSFIPSSTTKIDSKMNVGSINVTSNYTKGDTQQYIYIAPEQSKIITGNFTATGQPSDLSYVKISKITYGTSISNIGTMSFSDSAIANTLQAKVFH